MSSLSGRAQGQTEGGIRIDGEKKVWENGGEMGVKGWLHGSGSILLPGQVHHLTRVVCLIVCQSLFLIIFLCEHACVCEPVNRQTIGLGAGYERNQGPESVFCGFFFKGIQLGHWVPAFDFIWDRKCKEQNPVKIGIPVF